MQTKTLNDFLNEANKIIPRLSYEETMNLIENTKTFIIDVREESEVFNSGLIKNAIHIPRGVLEFKLSLNSPNNPINIDDQTNLLIYCAGGYRSALAAKTLKDIGFENVFNIGGFADWINAGGEIQAHQ